MKMIITTYNSEEDLIDKSQQLKGKTKLSFLKNLSNCYNEMILRNFIYQEDRLSINAQSIGKKYHEVLLIMKFLQTKPQVRR